MSALAVSPDAELPIAQAGLGAAAERYARLTLRKSEQTQATYLSTYRRFAEWLSHQTGHPDPPPATLTADAVAAYISELETRKAAATVKKERAAINRLAKYLHALGAIDATEILMIEGSRAAAQPRRRDALDAATWKRVRPKWPTRCSPGSSIASASSPLPESCFPASVASAPTGAFPTPALVWARVAQRSTTAGSPHTRSETSCAP